MIGGMSGGHGSDGGAQAVAFTTAWIAIFVCWPFVRTLIPIESQFAFADLVREHWAHRDALEPWLSRRWAWLALPRSEEHTSELQSLMRNSYAVFCLHKTHIPKIHPTT